jgi:hypothetical protein
MLAALASAWLATLAFAIGAAAPPARAAEPETSAKPTAPEPSASEATAPVDPTLIDPTARAAVARMVATLHDAQRMSYDVDSSYDAIQEDGELLEFGSHGTVLIKRPDRLRGRIWERNGNHIHYAWNGETLVVYDETQNVYASTPRTGDLDSLVDFLRDDVGMRLPVADLFMSDLRQMLIDNVVAARYLGKETLFRKFETEHVALRLRTGIDVQLWIQTGEHALPIRMILNFATADGRPQYRATFSDWDLDPSVREGLFEIDIPRGAKVVPFALRPRPVPGQPAQEEIE